MSLPHVRFSYPRRSRFAAMRRCLPSFVLFALLAAAFAAETSVGVSHSLVAAGAAPMANAHDDGLAPLPGGKIPGAPHKRDCPFCRLAAALGGPPPLTVLPLPRPEFVVLTRWAVALPRPRRDALSHHWQVRAPPGRLST
jgi:hypothetical protein